MLLCMFTLKNGASSRIMFFFVIVSFCVLIARLIRRYLVLYVRITSTTIIPCTIPGPRWATPCILLLFKSMSTYQWDQVKLDFYPPPSARQLVIRLPRRRQLWNDPRQTKQLSNLCSVRGKVKIQPQRPRCGQVVPRGRSLRLTTCIVPNLLGLHYWSCAAKKSLIILLNW